MIGVDPMALELTKARDPEVERQSKTEYGE
jgi:hypothetical protein